jgi:hypothetical protein
MFNKRWDTFEIQKRRGRKYILSKIMSNNNNNDANKKRKTKMLTSIRITEKFDDLLE